MPSSSPALRQRAELDAATGALERALQVCPGKAACKPESRWVSQKRRRYSLSNGRAADHQSGRRSGAQPSEAATIIDFGSDDNAWPDTGVNVQIMQPGQPNCRYHSEPAQEDFLVLHGDCIAIVNGEERPLKQWDFFHCPAGVEHVFVGAGDGPCAVLMIGSRRRDEPPVNEAAAKYGASVESATDEPDEAYADWRSEPWAAVASPWPLS